MEKRLPKNVIHQYIPWDIPSWVCRFLDQWQPNAVIWVESDFWPTIFKELSQRSIPLTLINGRMSLKSAKYWKWAQGLFKDTLKAIQKAYVQEEWLCELFKSYGIKTMVIKNIKYYTQPLSGDLEDIKSTGAMIGSRACWVASCTHPGEEEIILHHHKKLLEKFPQSLLILVPRHIDRSKEIGDLCKKNSFSYGYRSQEPVISDNHHVYIWDTLGELGLVYRICPIVFLGGSLVTIGGHNILEPLQLGCYVLHGPHMFNSPHVVEDFKKYGLIQEVTEDNLYHSVDWAWNNFENALKIGEEARMKAHVNPLEIENILKDLMETIS